MARNTDSSANAGGAKRQKANPPARTTRRATSPKKAAGRVAPLRRTAGHGALSKGQKRRLIRRISTTESENHRTTHQVTPVSPDRRDREAPTFYQPRESQRQMGRQDHQGSPGDSTDEQQPEEESEDEGMLAGLPRDARARSRMMGRIFALKIWPWPPSMWWIAKTEGGRAKLQPDGTGQLEDQVEVQFVGFLGIEMGMMDDEWMNTEFRQEVLIFFRALFLMLLMPTFTPGSFRKGHGHFDPTLFAF